MNFFRNSSTDSSKTFQKKSWGTACVTRSSFRTFSSTQAIFFFFFFQKWLLWLLRISYRIVIQFLIDLIQRYLWKIEISSTNSAEILWEIFQGNSERSYREFPSTFFLDIIEEIHKKSENIAIVKSIKNSDKTSVKSPDQLSRRSLNNSQLLGQSWEVFLDKFVK